MDKLRKKMLEALLVAMLGLGIGVFGPMGCNTAEGFGEDMESAGEEIQEGLEDDDDVEVDVD